MTTRRGILFGAIGAALAPLAKLVKADPPAAKLAVVRNQAFDVTPTSFARMGATTVFVNCTFRCD